MESGLVKFHIITAVWNAAPFFQGYADSILSQQDNYTVTVADDASTDGTTGIAEKICAENGWTFIARDANRGVPYQHYSATHFHQWPDDDVFVFVDGDDRLAPRALRRLRQHYDSDPGLQLTYGQYRSDPYSDTCSLAGEYPQDVIDRRAYREHSLLGRGIPWNHLRTVRCGLFYQLGIQDFQFENGEWYTMSGDAAVMYPCLELAGDNFKFIPDVLYIYNSENPLSEWRKAPREGDRVHQDVLHRRPKVEVGYDQNPQAARLREQRRMKELQP